MSASAQTLSPDHAARFFNETAEMLVVLSSTLTCIDASPAFCDFTGQPPASISTTPIKTFIYDEDWENFSTTLSNLRHGEKITRFDVRVKAANGAICHVDWSAKRSGDAFYCGLSDASEWLWRESMRAAHEDILSAILNRKDLTQILTSVCKHVEALVPGCVCSVQLLDATRTRIRNGAAPGLPTTYTDLLHDLEIGPNAGSCGTAIFTRTIVVAESIRTDPRWEDYREAAAAHGLAACWSIPLLDGENPPFGSFAIYHRHPHTPEKRETEVGKIFADVVAVAVKRREEYNQLMTARLEAESASKGKSDFLMHMSHELRTPLNAIIGFSDAMASNMFGPLGSDVYTGYARDIHASGEMLLSIIDRILNVARIEAGTLEIKEEFFCVADLVAECLHIVTLPGDKNSPRLEVAIAHPSIHLTADRQAVTSIILNLLSNAIKFTPAEGMIEIMVEHQDGGLHISVRDNGVGISEESLSDIGKPFVRAKTNPNLRSDGTGLGLFITRSLVELHGGRLEIKSEPEKGTEVTAIFPTDRVTFSAEAKQSASR